MHTIKLPTGEIKAVDFRLSSDLKDCNGREIFEGDRVTVHVDELEEYYREQKSYCRLRIFCTDNCDTCDYGADGLVRLLRQALKDGKILVAFNHGSLDLCLVSDVVNAPWILCPIHTFLFCGKYLEVVEETKNDRRPMAQNPA